MIDASGENYVNAVYGANARCDARQAGDAIAALGDGGLLLVQQEIPLEVSLEAMRAARSGGSTVILDPAPTHAADPTVLLAEADVITPNEHEASDLCGSAVDGPDAARSAARHLRSRGARGVIVTLAERGVWVESDDTSTPIDAPRVRAGATGGAVVGRCTLLHRAASNSCCGDGSLEIAKDTPMRLAAASPEART